MFKTRVISNKLDIFIPVNLHFIIKESSKQKNPSAFRGGICFVPSIIISLRTAEPLIKRSGGPFLGEGPRAMLEENLRLTEVLEQKKTPQKWSLCCSIISLKTEVHDEQL